MIALLLVAAGCAGYALGGDLCDAIEANQETRGAVVSGSIVIWISLAALACAP